MGTIPVSVDQSEGFQPDDNSGGAIRVIVADTQAIFRAGLRKVRPKRSRKRPLPSRNSPRMF
jgi:hypothetical protein